MIPQFKTNEEFWNTPLPHRPGQTARALMDDGLGDSEYSFEKYVSGAYGDKITEYFKTYALYTGLDDHPDVLAYWRNYGKGLHKYVHFHEDPYQSWSAYVPCSYDLPENKSRKYPCIIIGQRTTTMMQYEASSFIHMAARNEIIVLTGNDVNEDEYFENILDTGLAEYPIDPSRVYLHGHSFGAVLSGRHAIKYARRIAGVCMSGSQYYGADSLQSEIEDASKVRMPLIAIHCTNQSRNLLPYNVTPRRHMSPKNRMNATTSDFSLLTGYEEVKFWRMVNHCKPVSMEYMRNIQKLSEDRCEQVLGIQFDKTYIQQHDGVNHYFGDIYDDNQTVMLRYVAVEGGPHAVPPFAGDIAWEFLSEFSRDVQTGALIRQGKAVGDVDPFWTTAFPMLGYRTPGEYVALHGDETFCFKNLFTAELTDTMKTILHTRLHFSGVEHELAAYWADQGIRREVLESDGKKWVLYAPAVFVKAMSLVIYLGDTDDVMDAEASGIVQTAANLGMMTVIPEDVNNDSLMDTIVDMLERWGMLKKGCTYFAGFGFGAQCAGRHAIRMAGKIGAVALLGEQYYGYDNVPEEIAGAAKTGMPVIMIHGSCEERGILPLYANSHCPLPQKRADNVTVSTLSLISSFAEHAFWRQINGCKTVSLADMANTEASEDMCQCTIGAPLDETWTETEDGISILAGGIMNETGKQVICYTALKGAPHYPLPAAIRRACRFFADHSNNL